MAKKDGYRLVWRESFDAYSLSVIRNSQSDSIFIELIFVLENGNTRMMNLPRLHKLFNLEIFTIGDYTLHVYTILILFLIYFTARAIIIIIRIALQRRYKLNKMERGSAYALFQIIRYVIWVVVIALLLETVGVSLTVLLAGSAALLVGIGLGLQQTFNDMISGIILLTEGSTRIGDVLEIEDEVVIVQRIGLRTSKVMNRDYINVIVPNSQITTNKVINWSHQSKETRFKIQVHVAYGTNIDLVTRILEESVSKHPKVLQKRRIASRLLDFGESSLLFDVTFLSNEIFRIERIKSDIRKIIIENFLKNNITIPFPQRDLNIKSERTAHSIRSQSTSS